MKIRHSLFTLYLILYYSRFSSPHLDISKNTGRSALPFLVKEYSTCGGIPLNSAALDEYDLIGFASGIYYSKFEKRVLDFAKNNTPNGKNVFFIYTYGAEKPGYTKSIREALTATGSNILGEYGCLGFNTFGPFKPIGGIAKNHPDNTDITNAISFYNNLHK